ncbi:THxN family PEP-CTERM protein [Thalassotalea sp. G2M2-11]|uniref:THxN family PEP-CTERM protein n=1 Tax=Thalassotalea sp. G2M2-11 TaxID=2787627 RepID=UPI0019D2A596|nr:THxN family PEP-CTERM protein [Thalassotalea sp. G2M2-11]
MNSKLKVCASILAASILSSTASAGVVTEWTYSNQAGFLNWTGTTDSYGDTSWTDDDVAASGDSTGGGTNILDTNLDTIVDGSDTSLATMLEWGTPGFDGNGQKSSLVIDSPVNDTLTTNDWSWAQGTDITHNNYKITDDELTNATVLDGLALIPSSWDAFGDDENLLIDNAPYFAPQLAFGINFFETPNQATNCPDGFANGVGSNINGCGDIFQITGLDQLQLPINIGDDFIEFTVPFVLMGADNQPLEGWGDTVYLVTTRLSGLQTLESDECFNDNVNTSCPYGFVTIEEDANQLAAEFKIRTVPEPSTIAIFGLSIIGFSLLRRKKS